VIYHNGDREETSKNKLYFIFSADVQVFPKQEAFFVGRTFWIGLMLAYARITDRENKRAGIK
jgi:hypothetical protein